MLIEPEINAVSLVLLGNLNPIIFTPAWFARHGLITDTQADTAEVEIIHPQVAQFNAAGLSILVETGKFQVLTTEAPFVRLSDLVQRVFGELLPHTPLGRMGINRDAHFNVGQEIRDHIGECLAPPSAWGDWGKKISASKGSKHGGVRSIIMEDQDPGDRDAGYVRVTVQPSNAIPNNSGIFIGVNDHYALSEAQAAPDALGTLRFLQNNAFDRAMQRADELTDIVLRLKDAK